MKGRQSRRRFLSDAARSTAALSLAAWASPLARADIAPPPARKFPIIDTHTHFYDPTRVEGVPWPPREDKLLYRRVLPGDYKALQTPRPVTGTVVVEASPIVEDNQWILDLAAKDPFVVGFVGNLTAGTKQFAGHLKRFSGNKIFRGIRLRDRKLSGALQDPALVSDLKLLASYDLSIDLVGGLETVRFATALAALVPDLRIIIDHLAGVVVNGDKPDPSWRREMASLARLRSIYFKVSGLVEGTGKTDGTAPRDASFYAPVLDFMDKTFGVERLLYGSNWPVSERFAPLSTVQGIVQDYFRGQGSRAEEQVFALTAKAAYKWVDRHP